MVRTYKKKGSTLNYTEEDVAKALVDIEEGLSIRAASRKYGVPVSSLHQRLTGRSRSPRKIGRKTCLLRVEELAIAQNLSSLGDFGMAFDVNKLRRFVKHYLDSQHCIIQQFRDNLPGVDWAQGFLHRHSTLLSVRLCQNISRKRATVTEADVAAYFERLRKTLEGVSPNNIINYDETNLTDDPQKYAADISERSQTFRENHEHVKEFNIHNVCCNCSWRCFAALCGV